MKVSFISESGTRSCGRLGPAREGTTESRSSSKVSVNSGSGVDASRKRCCARAVGLDALDDVRGAPGHAQVAQRLGVDREVSDRGTVLGRHVADGGAIRQGHGVQAGAEELDELVDDALLPQHLRDREHQIRGRDALAKPAVQLEADHIRAGACPWAGRA